MVRLAPIPRLAQGQNIGMRMPPDEPRELQHLQGVLHFDDGGMKGLACAVVWCSLLYHGLTLKDDELANPSVVELARSLLAIPTYHRSREVDESSAMISRIIKQNVDSKKQAVSSYEWSVILKNMGATNPNKSKALTVQEAIDMYNQNPEVAAHGGSGKD